MVWDARLTLDTRLHFQHLEHLGIEVYVLVFLGGEVMVDAHQTSHPHRIHRWNISIRALPHRHHGNGYDPYHGKILQWWIIHHWISPIDPRLYFLSVLCLAWDKHSRLQRMIWGWRLMTLTPDLLLRPLPKGQKGVQRVVIGRCRIFLIRTLGISIYSASFLGAKASRKYFWGEDIKRFM